MSENTYQTVKLADYTSPSHVVESIDLVFDLHETHAIVKNTLVLSAHQGSNALVLNGENLELCRVVLDDQALSATDYVLTDTTLTLRDLPTRFTLVIETRIKPQENTRLMGLYRSNGLFCTQCEAEGFRRITYYLDRPDVMSAFTTTIIADKSSYPVLLSNGNLVERGEADDNRHWVKWQDPFKKPCYLFALVAGDLAVMEDTFTTSSGRTIDLHIYADPSHISRCEHAMHSLKRAMRWDEKCYGREYDLDNFMIVAVNDFNMGAMENKGLNIFNTQCVLADPDTATDREYEYVEAVVAHEYFHNWTGNRVTCRDWFQLSLKEGLTVFRDQEFSRDMNSRDVVRIEQVRQLRKRQFAEDAGPLAHPVQPKSYIEINNFYTATIYEKGAEVIRMLHTLLGVDGFRQGMDLYFERHDGQAVTIEHFVTAMEDANQRQLTQFRHWYDEVGTPCLDVATRYDADQQLFMLDVKQSLPDKPQTLTDTALHIPLALTFFDGKGHVLSQGVVEITDHQQTIALTQVPEAPQVSLLNHFSAPIVLRRDYTLDELYFLLEHDNDGFSRWEAGQCLLIELFKTLSTEKQRVLPKRLVSVYEGILSEVNTDPALRAQLLALPEIEYLLEQLDTHDVECVYELRTWFRKALAAALREPLQAQYQQLLKTQAKGREARANRSLQNTCLAYLACLNEPETMAFCVTQYQQAQNMTDRFAALQALTHCDVSERIETLQDFYNRFQHDDLVIDKWFSVQAQSELPDTLAHVQTLTQHKAFDYKNPNKVRSLIGVFSQRNVIRFHQADGAGYHFLADQVMQMDRLNPQIAARLVTPLTQWLHYDEKRQKLMRAQLARIMEQKLSSDVYETVSKSV